MIRFPDNDHIMTAEPKGSAVILFWKVQASAEYGEKTGDNAGRV